MSQTSKNALLNALGNTLYDGSQWLITVAAVRFGGFDIAGVLSLAMSVSLIFRTVAYFGVRNFQISDEAGTFSDSDHLAFRKAASAAAFLLCLIFSAAAGYRGSDLAVILCFMLFRISEGFTDLTGGCLQKSGRLDAAGVLLCIKAAVTLAVFIGAFLLTSSLTVSAAAMAAAAFILLPTVEFPAVRRYKKDFLAGAPRKHRIGELLKMAAVLTPVFFHSALVALIFNLPKICLSIVTDDAQVGVYSSVFSLAVTVQALFRYIYTPYITHYSALLHEGNRESAAVLMRKITAALAGVTAAACLFWRCFGDRVLTAVYGSCDLYSHILMPAVTAACVYSFMSFVSVTVIVKRKTSLLLGANAVGTALSAVLSFVFTRLRGINGVSYAMTAGCAAAAVIMVLYPYTGQKSVQEK